MQLNEEKRIIDGSNELIAEFLSQMVLILDSKQPLEVLLESKINLFPFWTEPANNKYKRGQPL